MSDQVMEEVTDEKNDLGLPQDESAGNENKQNADNSVSIEGELKKAKSEIESLKDSWARERAEFQNFKRRTSHDYMNLKKEAIKTFVVKLLTPLDDLDRASNNANNSGEAKPFAEGLSLIKRELFAVLEKENIRKVEPKGELFDPMHMEAIASEESAEFTDERVLDVYQPGYEMTFENNEKVTLRPSRVKVGRPLN